jgi:hypothetical protein
VLEACGEFGVSVIGMVHKDWVKGGRAFTVARPGSLTNTIRAKVGELRADREQHSHPVGISAYDPETVAAFQARLNAVARSEQPLYGVKDYESNLRDRAKDKP